ncbi:MAG TPA: AAA family ATPase, partial [Polyangiaceae bacterium]
DSIVQIKREFRTAAELVHPNLVRLHELFSDGFEWFFTMDLVDGDTLTKLVEQPNEVDYDLLRRIFWQLALGLTELHRAGAIHGDLKPSNFLIAGPERRVVLLDFGLSRPIGPAQDHQFAGTPAYMAPEQMLGQALSEAADWYAFGVVLYEALTGELPLRRPSAARLERAPADLGSLCLKLLKLSPADRPRGSEVLALMGSSPIGERFSAATPPPSRRSMIGRNDELSQLEAALAKSVDAPAMVLIEGPSGIGKTSLVERFVPHAYAQSAWVLVGRCRERESMGYKAVDGLIDDLVALLSELPEAEAASLLPENIIDLTVLFPALRGARAIAQAHGQGLEIPDHGVARQRAVAAFCELFANMRARAPVVIWIDDLQWSDGESALLIGRLLGGPDRVPVLMIGTYRSDPSGRGPLLEALLSDRTLLLPRPVEIELGPLSPMDAERLALDLLPSDEPRTAAIARDIGRDAGGNPLFIAELAYSAVQSNTERGLGAPGSPVTLSDLVKKRIAMLPPSAQRLLEAAAVAGAPLPRSVLARTQKMDPVETQASLDLLRANRLARTKGLGEADAVDIHHDRVREIVIQGLNDDQRRTHHLGLARVLEARLDTKPDVLASHYEGGGERALAGRYWLEGAHIAFQALAFEHAADLYAKGTSLALLDAPERRKLHVRRAEALAYAGKGPAAADVYLAIAAESEPTAALELRRRAAEQLLLSGHLDRGLPVIEQVL